MASRPPGPYHGERSKCGLIDGLENAARSALSKCLALQPVPSPPLAVRRRPGDAAVLVYMRHAHRIALPSRTLGLNQPKYSGGCGDAGWRVASSQLVGPSFSTTDSSLGKLLERLHLDLREAVPDRGARYYAIHPRALAEQGFSPSLSRQWIVLGLAWLLGLFI